MCQMYLRHFQDGVLHLRFGVYLLSLGVSVNVLCYNTVLCWTVAGSRCPSNQLLPLKKIIARKPPSWEVTLCVGRLVSAAC